ncbi:MAG: hypothetical protein EOM02_14455, partial [Synergistales bacterium]|nr:hypothetical protein [Synergistales bacterium]
MGSQTKPNVLFSTADMSREEWLEKRKMGIGGSDAAKIIGISPYGGPLSVFMDKKGMLASSDSDSEAAYWGTTLEEVVALEFSKRTDIKVRKQNKMFQHPEYPWMIANVDRVIVGENKGLECKTASAYLDKLWDGDELPDIYYAQIQHYIEVMGWDSCWVAALIGGQKFVYKEVQRDEAFIKILVEAERAFWLNHMETDEAPDIIPSDPANQLFPKQEDDDVISPDEETLTMAQELADLSERYKSLKEQKDALENALKGKIKDHSGIDGVATWKQSKPRVKVDYD